MTEAKKLHPAILARESSLNITAQPENDQQLAAMCLTYSGPLAKFPSVANSRLVNFHKSPIAKQIRYGTKNSALHALAKARVFNTANPNYKAHLEAMRILLDRRMRSLSIPPFNDGPDRRLHVFILCGRILDRIDSHNTIKAICDFLEGAKLINNDRYVDATALRMPDSSAPDDVSSIVVVQQRFVMQYFRQALDTIGLALKFSDQLGLFSGASPNVALETS